MAHECWVELCDQAHHLKELRDRSPSKFDASVYRESLLKFRYLLEFFTMTRHFAAETAIYSSPAWRPKFLRLTSPCENDLPVVTKRGLRLTGSQTEFLRRLRGVRIDARQSSITKSVDITDELHRLMRKNPDLESMVTPYVAKLLADQTILMQCLRSLHRHQPWADICDNEIVYKKRDEELYVDFLRSSLIIQGFRNLVDAPGDAILASCRRLKRDGLQYPVDQRRTKVNVDTMRMAESRLDGFWNSLEGDLAGLGVKWDSTAASKLFGEPQALRRTPEWTELDEAAVAKRGKKTTSGVVLPFKFNSEMYLDLEQRTERTVDKTKSYCKFSGKAKAKSAPKDEKPEVEEDDIEETSAVEDVADPDPVTAPEPDPPVKDGPESPKIIVTTRALEVFEAIFFHPSMTNTPGEVSWKDFLHAMTSAGFETRKLQGSMWEFVPTKMDSTRNIIFHAPHPSPKMKFWLARRYGRRLQRAYGWDWTTFALESAGDD